jgi:hypothetical protein
MQIKDLFSKDIARSINGVVKADQLDDASIWQELDEYVVTRELDQHLRRFFGAYLNALDHAKDADASGKIGIWVSGFFGSGKSHFIKVLSYLLENRAVTSQDETKRAIDFFQGKIADPLLYADIKRAVGTSTDVVLFNIDSKADPRKGRDAILSVFLRVFNEMQGFSGDHPHIARMERYLQSQGKLDPFHDAYKTAGGKEWIEERDAYEFNQDELIGALAQALGQSRESATQWLERAETNFPLTPQNFAKWVKEYLDTQGPQHRILFLADEIGQFIGSDTHLMLSLQTITEDLGVVCGGRAWVVVTSQENIEAVLGEVKASKANDFSKIQGRFKTRLLLSSANTDEVIQSRLLSKTSEAVAELRELYAAKGDILKNQLSFVNVGMTFKRIDGEDSFLINYPFVPYQFQLVQKVFEDIRKHGATGLHLSRGERSMLDAFQFAAQLISDKPVGALVPLYRFYPSIESFLDTSIKRTIDQAIDRSLDTFDVEVLRVLFLIRYIDEFKGNVDNLVTLCIDEIDTDRLALRRHIEESLLRLERETLVSRNGENYFFLTNEERDITREIKDVEIVSAEEIKKLGELIFHGVLKDNNKHRFPTNKKDFGFNRFCDGHPIGSVLTANDLIVAIISPLADDYETYGESRSILESSTDGGKLLIKLENDERLGRELSLYLKTDKYVRRKSDDSLPPATKQILRARQEENHQRDARLVDIVEEMLLSADYYVAGQTRVVQASSASTAISEQLTYLIENTFPKLGYLQALQGSDEACRIETQGALRANDVGQQSLEIQADNVNAQAYAELRSFIDLSGRQNRQVVLNELLDRFARRPFGWPDYETILLLSRLLVVGEISLMMEGATVPAERAFEPLTKPAKWRTVTVFKRRTVDTAVLQKARSQGLELFSVMGPDTEETLVGFLRDKLGGWQTDLRTFKPLADTGRYPGQTDMVDGLKLLIPLLGEKSSFEFIEKFLAGEVDLKEFADTFQDLSHFYTQQKPTWDRLLEAAAEFKPNQSELEKDSQASAALTQMQTLLNAPAPYGLIKDADGLILQARTVNVDLIDQRRAKALEKVDMLICEVERELERTDTFETLGNKSLYPVRMLRTRIETEMSLGNIQLYDSQAGEQIDLAIDGIEREVQKVAALERARQEAHSSKEPPSLEPGAAIAMPPKPIQDVKTSRIVKPIELMKKPFLETDEDVNEFVEALSSRLHAAIADNARIRIR